MLPKTENENQNIEYIIKIRNDHGGERRWWKNDLYTNNKSGN